MKTENKKKNFKSQLIILLIILFIPLILFLLNIVVNIGMTLFMTSPNAFTRLLLLAAPSYFLSLFIFPILFGSELRTFLTILAILAGTGLLFFYRASKIVLILALVNIIGLFYFLNTYSNYQTTYKAQEGYIMKWVTNPNIFEKISKGVLSGYELRGCDYELKGWDKTKNLYYQKDCDGIKSIYSFNYDTDDKGKKVNELPTNLSNGDTCDKNLSAKTLQLQNNLYPVGTQNPSKNSVQKMSPLEKGKYLFYEGFSFSLDCSLLAIEESHFYGPHDIIVVNTEQ